MLGDMVGLGGPKTGGKSTLLWSVYRLLCSADGVVRFGGDAV
ncbi:hypothetical protein [Streptomyces sp. NPDC004250]